MNALFENFQSAVSPPRILIVDDDSTTRFFQRIILEKDGYLVTEAEDGAQALSIYERLQPNLILLDAMMPLLDGFSTCARLRAISANNHIPILMVTALQDDEAINRAFEVGATDYIIKPVNTTVLRHRVQRLLNAQQAASALRHNERYYQAVVEDQTDLLCRFLPDGTLTFVNESYCRWLGKSVEELVGDNFLQFIPTESREEVERQISLLSWTNQVDAFETKLTESNGDIHWQQWTLRAILGDEGNLIEVQVIGHNITDLKQVSYKLSQKTAGLQIVIEGIHALFFLLNSVGFILDYHIDSASNMLLSSEVITGKHLQEVLRSEVALLILEAVAKVHQTKVSCNLKYSLSLEAGEQTFQVQYWPFLDSQVILLVRHNDELNFRVSND